MLWSALAHIFSLLLELLRIGRLSDQEKDIEILVLRYQLGIADRKLGAPHVWHTQLMRTGVHSTAGAGTSLPQTDYRVGAGTAGKEKDLE